jgi:hypothetical protein
MAHLHAIIGPKRHAHADSDRLVAQSRMVERQGCASREIRHGLFSHAAA